MDNNTDIVRMSQSLTDFTSHQVFSTTHQQSSAPLPYQYHPYNVYCPLQTRPSLYMYGGELGLGVLPFMMPYSYSTVQQLPSPVVVPDCTFRTKEEIDLLEQPRRRHIPYTKSQRSPKVAKKRVETVNSISPNPDAQVIRQDTIDGNENDPTVQSTESNVRDTEEVQVDSVNQVNRTDNKDTPNESECNGTKKHWKKSILVAAEVDDVSPEISQANNGQCAVPGPSKSTPSVTQPRKQQSLGKPWQLMLEMYGKNQKSIVRPKSNKHKGSSTRSIKHRQEMISLDKSPKYPIDLHRNNLRGSINQNKGTKSPMILTRSKTRALPFQTDK